MIDALGIVNLESAHIRGLGDYRSIPALSFLGRYRIIDFVLSNMVNSGIDKIKIMVDSKPRSLIEHLGTGSQYNINFKHGDIQILYPESLTETSIYYHDIFVMKEYADYIQQSNRKYVVIAPSYMISTIDYGDVIEAHEKSGADVTCVYYRANCADKHFIGCKHLVMDRQRRISAVKENVGMSEKANIFMETYVMTVDQLLKLLKQASSISPLFGLVDILGNVLDELNVVGYQYRDYVKCINTLEEYYETNLKLADREYAKQLFREDWPIYTKTNDSTPTFYSPQAVVKGSVISNGCVVQGTVENCVLGRGVKIRRGAVVRNSVLLPYTEIGEDANVDYAVIDKYGKVLVKKDIVGTPDDIIYIKRKDRV